MKYLTEDQVIELNKGNMNLTHTVHRSWYEDEWTEEQANMLAITRLVNLALQQQGAEHEVLIRYIHTRVIPLLSSCVDHPSMDVIVETMTKLIELTVPEEENE